MQLKQRRVWINDDMWHLLEIIANGVGIKRSDFIRMLFAKEIQKFKKNS